MTALLGGTLQRACGCGTCGGCGGGGAGRSNDDAERESADKPEVTVSRRLDTVPAAEASAVVVQRAKIDYRTLTWGDFKGGAPAGGFAATTASGIRASDPLKKLTATTDQKTSCPLPAKGKAPAKTGSMFAASIRIDPATYDAVKGFMSQEQSKVLADVVKGFAGQTAKSVEACGKSFDDEAKQVAKDGAAQCGTAAKDCSEKFKAGSTSYQIKLGPGTVTASTAKDCSASFLKDCKTAYVASSKPEPYNETVAPDAKCPAAPSGDKIATAASKADCAGTFKTARAAYGAGWSKNILAHEQLHFAITDKAAQDLKKELVAKAGSYKVEEADCTSGAANAKATKAWAALGAEKALQEAEKAGNKGLGATQSSYDDETCHGVIPAKQAEWAKKYTKTQSKTP